MLLNLYSCFQDSFDCIDFVSIVFNLVISKFWNELLIRILDEILPCGGDIALIQNYSCDFFCNNTM